MRKYSVAIIFGMVFFLIGFCLVFASLGIEHYVYQNNIDKYRYERIMLNTCGEISVFVGFCIMHSAVILKLKHSGQW